MKRAVVFTLGCKVNSCESGSLIRGLTDLGYEVSDRLEYADLYILNTCAVTAEAERKSRQAVARAKKFNPDCRIIVTGCASEKAPRDFLDKQNVTLVTGAQGKSKILQMLSATGHCPAEKSLEFEEMPRGKSLKTRAYIKIQDGCDSFCGYCIVPYLRGRSRSRSPQSILSEINACTAAEVVLTGINISAYDYGGVRLTELIAMLADTDKRIRLGSLEEGIVDREFLLSTKKVKNFMPHFHLSLQSGSNAVLKSMNRRYTAKQYLEAVDLVRQYYPNAGITTDIICGYPTETEDDFLRTLELADAVGFSAAHCFCYSPRPGTAAASLKDLPAEVKKDRLERLIKKTDLLKERFLNANIGKEAKVLFEEFDGTYSSGYSENYIKVYASGQFEGVKKAKLLKGHLDGLLCDLTE